MCTVHGRLITCNITFLYVLLHKKLLPLLIILLCNLFQLATKVTKFFIEHFGRRDLFGRENYEFYARLTGRILKVEDEYIFFTYPPAVAGHYRSRDDTDPSLDPLNRRHRSASPGAGVAMTSSGAGGDDAEVAALKEKTGSLEIIPENCPLDPAGRLSISLDDQNVSSPSSVGSPGATAAGGMVAAGVTIHRGAGDSSVVALRRPGDPVSGAEFRIQSGRGPGEMKSYTCLPQVRFTLC